MSAMRWTRAEVRQWLDAWARWHNARGSYGDSPLWGALGAPRERVPRSMPPHGVEPHPIVLQVIQALDAGWATGHGEAMRVLRCWYCAPHRQESATAERVAAELGMAKSRVYERRHIGETFIAAWLQGRSVERKEQSG